MSEGQQHTNRTIVETIHDPTALHPGQDEAIQAELDQYRFNDDDRVVPNAPAPTVSHADKALLDKYSFDEAPARPVKPGPSQSELDQALLAQYSFQQTPAPPVKPGPSESELDQALLTSYLFDQ